jgi:hypothetical protein
LLSSRTCARCVCTPDNLSTLFQFLSLSFLSFAQDRCAMIQHAQQFEFFVEACVHYASAKNHPYQLIIEKEPVEEETQALTAEELEVRTHVRSTSIFMHARHTSHRHCARKRRLLHSTAHRRQPTALWPFPQHRSRASCAWTQDRSHWTDRCDQPHSRASPSQYESHHHLTHIHMPTGVSLCGQCRGGDDVAVACARAGHE